MSLWPSVSARKKSAAEYRTRPPAGLHGLSSYFKRSGLVTASNGEAHFSDKDCTVPTAAYARVNGCKQLQRH